MRTVPLAVWRLMFAFALMMAGTALTVLIAGIVGSGLAPTPGLATLPVALAVVGVASSTLPTGRLLHHFGRRRVFQAYGVIAVLAAGLCALALVWASFTLYCGGTLLMGWAAAAGHQYRFAAIDLVPPGQAPAATSVLLLGGILGAFLGPEMAVRGRYLLEVEFAGSYMLLALGYVGGMVILAFYREHGHSDEAVPDGGGRPLGEILRQPVVILAVAAATIAYSLMSFLMVATPISMHQHDGHSLEATKWVLQSHIAGMYVPSLFFALLLGRLGYRVLLWSGLAAYGLTLVAALAGSALLNYWVALVLLGVGWNFLFLSATNLLTGGYRREERFRVQSFNDFMVFSVQALCTLGSGWALTALGWRGLLWVACLPVAALAWLLLSSPVLRSKTRLYKGEPVSTESPADETL